jgi:hypothetical protein
MVTKKATSASRHLHAFTHARAHHVSSPFSLDSVSYMWRYISILRTGQHFGKASGGVCLWEEQARWLLHKRGFGWIERIRMCGFGRGLHDAGGVEDVWGDM